MHSRTSRHIDFFASTGWISAGELLGSMRMRKNTVNSNELAMAQT
jgi:hypothetical protein